MKFKPLIIKKELEIKKYFIKYGLQELLEVKKFISKKPNEMKDSISFLPELDDLYLLHKYIILFKRMTVLEFGHGWSTLVMANAIDHNRKKYLKLKGELRLNNGGEVHCIDNYKKWINKTKIKVKKYSKFVKFHHSDVYMDTFNGRICTSFNKIPNINPDFIYLDGPDQFNIKGKINSFNIGHKDFMPMTSDILKIEHFLKPGTIIVVDGRAANSRFLKTNFQRNWKYFYNSFNDQHVFLLDEKPLGTLNKNQLKFYFGKK